MWNDLDIRESLQINTSDMYDEWDSYTAIIRFQGQLLMKTVKLHPWTDSSVVVSITYMQPEIKKVNHFMQPKHARLLYDLHRRWWDVTEQMRKNANLPW